MIQEKRSVSDAVHGTLTFEKIVWQFIDTPHFQRLRHIKQLACLQYIYPCANHTRFQHSLGTAYLARKCLHTLIKNNQKYYKMKRQQIESALRVVTIAGLLHDIGHGPFSHAFDSQIVKQIQNGQIIQKWSHQLAGQYLFDHMINYLIKNNRKIPQKDQIKRIKAMLSGRSQGFERNWQFGIISNQQNGIDVDKLDYFRRDAFYLGAKNVYINHDQLFNVARIKNNKICYPAESIQLIFSIFSSRYYLYKNYYFEVVNKGIQMMICDIFKLIKNKYKFQNACNQLKDCQDSYIKLTDGIVDTIEGKFKRMKQQDPQYNNFEKAVQLIRKIKTRNIYNFVKQFNYYIRQNQQQIKQYFQNNLKSSEIQKFVCQYSKTQYQDIFVTISDVTYGKSKFNPIKKVGFFRKQLQQDSKILSDNQIQKLSMLLTDTFFQCSIKLYYKKTQKDQFSKIGQALQEYINQLNSKIQKNVNKKIRTSQIFQRKGGITPYIKNRNDQRQNRKNPISEFIIQTEYK